MMGKPKGSANQMDTIKIGQALGRLKGWARFRQRTTRQYGIQRTYIRVGTAGDDSL